MGDEARYTDGAERPERRNRAAEGLPLDLSGAKAVARPSGALWLPETRALVVADLHLGKSERVARRGGPLLPPYEGLDTLERLQREIAALAPQMVISLGDGFDDARAARAPDAAVRDTLLRLMAGRRWVWILGNHDPAPPGFGGEARVSLSIGPLRLRHAALRGPAAGPAAVMAEPVEISAHYHPKAQMVIRGRKLSRRCFLWDGARLILPAFGAYTGGLPVDDPAFDALMGADALALVLSGDRVLPFPRAHHP